VFLHSIPVEEFIDPGWLDPLMHVLIYHDDWRQAAGAKAAAHLD